MASNTTITTRGTIAVIDTGWSSAWNTGLLVAQYDFANGDGDARDTLLNTHGAMVTSSIMAHAPDTGIISLKVTPDGSTVAEGGVIEQALQWVVANADTYGIVGVNLSLAGGSAAMETTTLLSDELALLASKRILVSAAAGNAGHGDTGTDVSVYAADPNVICVSASTGEGGLPDWSQRNSDITDLCADGTAITLTNSAKQSYLVSGSSFAAPTVTAAVALAQQEALALRGTLLTHDEFVAYARASGTLMGDTGYRELDTGALLAKLSADLAPPIALSLPSTSLPSTGTGETAIVVTAHGTMAGGTNAHFTLLLDGTPFGEATVDTISKEYRFTVAADATTGHELQIRYDNDAIVENQDRNLTVTGVAINGHAVAVSDPSVSYDRGALDGRDILAGRSDLFWEGSLVVRADHTLFGAATASLTAGTVALDAATALWLYGTAVAAPSANISAPTWVGWGGETLPTAPDLLPEGGFTQPWNFDTVV